MIQENIHAIRVLQTDCVQFRNQQALHNLRFSEYISADTSDSSQQRMFVYNSVLMYNCALSIDRPGSWYGYSYTL